MIDSVSLSVKEKIMVTFAGNNVKVEGNFPQVGTKAPSFSLVDKDLNDTSLENFSGKKKVILILSHCLKISLKRPQVKT